MRDSSGVYPILSLVFNIYFYILADRIKNTLSTSVNGTTLARAASTLKDRIGIDWLEK